MLQTWSNDELARHICDSPRLAPNSNIFLLSKNLLAKHHEPDLIEDTAQAMDVACRLGIRVPSVKRIVKNQENAYCIMQRIEGATLEEGWTQLGWLKTVQLALQLRRYVNLLRSITSLTSGSLVTGTCRSFWLEDSYGLPAKSSPEDIASFIKFWIGFKSIRHAKTAAANGPMHSKVPEPPTANGFVFTHHDLAPRNIILDRSGRLWLLDWDYAGFYPKYFEYASMQNFLIHQDWNFFARFRWRLFTWIAVGCSEEDARILRQVRSRFHRCPVGRRFEILRNGAPARYPAS